MNIKEELYVFYRRLQAGVAYFVGWVMAVRYPIQPNKVVFCSTEGMGGYGDHPKAIAEYLHAHHPELELVWLVNDMTKDFPDYIRKVPNTLGSRAYEYATAKIWVDSHRKPYGTRKRVGQYYLQTWHGPIGFKPIGARRGKKLPKIAELVSRADSKMIDAFLSNSQWNTDNVLTSLYYHGPMVKWGSPRCDILFDEAQRQAARRRLQEKYHFPDEAKLLIYAPTFRSGSQRTQRSVGAETASLDFERIVSALREHTGEPWYVVLRLHPQAAAHIREMPLAHEAGAKLLEMSQYPDVYDILAAGSAVVTDYSSLVFDGAYAGMPGFLFADDIEQWENDRGGLLFDLRKLPFPFAATEDELIANLLHFDAVKYQADLRRFFQSVGLLEDGHASERAADWILKYMQL